MLALVPIWPKRVLVHVVGARALGVGEPGGVGVGVELREKQLEVLRLGLALRGVTLRGVRGGSPSGPPASRLGRHLPPPMR